MVSKAKVETSFKRIIKRLPKLLEQLESQPLLHRDELIDIPDEGIYVFYEGRRALYVGRSTNLKTRIQSHSRKCSKHASASFAFNIAKMKTRRKGLEIDPDQTRKALQKDEIFKALFKEAKKRVSKMKVRVVEIKCPNTQTVFELYAALKFKTKYNDFDTH